jgi:hypothetical protein
MECPYRPTAQEHPSQVLTYGAPWTPLAEQAIPQTHTEGGGAPELRYIYTGWGGGWSGAHARDHRTSAAGQTANTAPPARCSTDAVDVPAAGDGLGSRREKRGAEEKVEVCSVTQSEGVSEEVGPIGGERLGLLGRARAALGRFAAAIPRGL